MIPNPSQIRFHWIEDDQFPGTYALRAYWTPFVAACLLLEMLPGAVEADGSVSVGRELNLREDGSYEQDPRNDELAQHVIALAGTLASNWRGAADAPVQDIVRWAVENDVVAPRSFWPNRLLPEDATAGEPPFGTNAEPQQVASPESAAAKEERYGAAPPDKRGAHAAERREHILGAALHALASEEVWKATVKGKAITAAKLAKHIDDHRRRYGIPDEVSGGTTGETYGYSTENILKTIRGALGRCKTLPGSGK